MKVKVFNKEKVVLNKIIEVLESGRIEGLTDEASNMAHYNVIINIINEYEEGKRYYHKLDGIMEEYVKKNYAHFGNDKYYSEVEIPEKETEENKVKGDLINLDNLYDSIEVMRKEIAHISEGIELIVFDMAQKLILSGEITDGDLDGDLMEILKQIKSR